MTLGWRMAASTATSRRKEAASVSFPMRTHLTAASPPRQLPRNVCPNVPSPITSPRLTCAGHGDSIIKKSGCYQE